MNELPFQKPLNVQIELNTPINPSSVFRNLPKALKRGELLHLPAFHHQHRGKSDFTGYLIRKYMSLPTFTEAISKATFIQVAEFEPVLRIDRFEADIGKILCHDEDAQMRGPCSISLDFTELDPHTVKLYEMKPLEFRTDSVK